jgi:hypothetical protein
MDEGLDEYIFSGSMTPSTSKTGMFYTPDLKKHKVFMKLDTNSFKVAEIRTKHRSVRKSAAEEFFYLTAQSVKMNSAYLDAICTVSTKELYLQAQFEKVPFHKVRTKQWQTWLEQTLGQLCISNSAS